MKHPEENTTGRRAVECSELIRASPGRLFAIYADVARWAEWDPETRAAAMSAPLCVGARGWIRPRKGLRVNMFVSRLVADRQLDFLCPVLGSAMHFEHRIELVEAGLVRVTHLVRFEGWLASWLYSHVGKPLRENLPRTLANLKVHAERQPAATGAR